MTAPTAEITARVRRAWDSYNQTAYAVLDGTGTLLDGMPVADHIYNRIIIDSNIRQLNERRKALGLPTVRVQHA